MSLEELNQERTNKALAAALKEAEDRERQDGPNEFDVDADKMVIFSDLHKGAKDRADDFRPSESAYFDALGYFYDRGHTLVSLGDVEELWEERPKTVLRTYQRVLEQEARFHQDKRLFRVWGNHDDNWRYASEVRKHLDPLFGGRSMDVREGILIQLKKGDAALGRLFLVHGHQGTLDSDRFSAISRLIVRHVWRPFQRLTGISLNTPAKDWTLRRGQDTLLYRWSEKQEKLLLIAGHTHRPVFKSISHEDTVKQLLEQAREFSAKESAETDRLADELAWVQAQNRGEAVPEWPVVFGKPSYFNTGCCAFTDGRITGLELAAGHINLLRWPDGQGSPQPEILASASLDQVYQDL